MKKDRYIIRKYIYARSAKEAIRLDKKCNVHDVWIDEDYKKDNKELVSAIGFETEEKPKNDTEGDY